MSDVVDNSTISGLGCIQSMNSPQFRLLMGDARWRMLYPAPYFDPIAVQTIMDPKIMMHWGRFFYDWHPIIHAAINKMVNYPITDFVFDCEDKQAERRYKEIFDKLNVRSILVRMGLDYFVLGNAYFSMIMPFKRMLECPECHSAWAADQAKFKVNATKLQMQCPHCGKVVDAIIKDSNSNRIEDIRPILWDPLNMKVDYDEVLNTSEYFYAMPGSVASDLNKGNVKLWSTYPMYFIEAARKKKLIKLYPEKVLHLKRDTHSSAYNKGYGQPIISPVLKYLFHLLILLRAQDALAVDQILPWTLISPSSNGSVDPAGDLDLGRYAAALQNEYKEYKKNPLRKSIMPIPVNAQIVGAQGKALMLTNEIQEITNQILAGMSVPNEFIYGGLQWSGASVSLRMLENQFINYRAMMQDVIDYIVKCCRVYFNLPNINVRMQPFKMADDIAQKDFLMRMAESGIISKQTLLKEILGDLDYDDEQKKVQEESLKQQEDQIKLQIAMQNASSMLGISNDPQSAPSMNGDSGMQHGDLPEQNPPQAQGANAQI